MSKFDLMLNQEQPKENLMELLMSALSTSQNSDFYMTAPINIHSGLYRPGNKYGINRVGVDIDEIYGATVILWSHPDGHGDQYDTFGIVSEIKEKTTHVDRFIIVVRGDGMIPVALRVDHVSQVGSDIQLDATKMGRWKGVKAFVDQYL